MKIVWLGGINRFSMVKETLRDLVEECRIPQDEVEITMFPVGDGIPKPLNMDMETEAELLPRLVKAESGNIIALPYGWPATDKFLNACANLGLMAMLACPVMYPMWATDCHTRNHTISYCHCLPKYKQLDEGWEFLSGCKVSVDDRTGIITYSYEHRPIDRDDVIKAYRLSRS